jgi:hypothetical protein
VSRLDHEPDLGILSVTCCTPLGIVAFVMGNNALKEIDAHPGRYSNRQIVQLGRILGIIGMVFLVISIIWFLFFGVPWAWSLLGHDVPRGSTGGTWPAPRNFSADMHLGRHSGGDCHVVEGSAA